MVNELYVEKEVSLGDLAKLLNITTNVPSVVDIDDMGIEVDTPNGFKQISTYVVKQRSKAWKLGDLLATSNHRVLVDDEWKSVSELQNAIPLEEMIDVVDIEVPDGDCYNANGFVNHNTSPGG